jgi:hypothetical protein
VLRIRIRDKKFVFPDPTPELSKKIWGKKLTPIFSILKKKANNFQFCEIYGYKKVPKCPARPEEKEVLDTSS